METPSEFKELLGLLNSHKVDYIVVGAWALAYHGAPRYTGDLDIFVRPESANAARIMAALDDFGFGDAGLANGDFTQEDQVIQLGVAPVRVDFITGLTGVTWEQAESGSVESEIAGAPVLVLGRDELIANKRALGRARDIADLEAIT